MLQELENLKLIIERRSNQVPDTMRRMVVLDEWSAIGQMRPKNFTTSLPMVETFLQTINSSKYFASNLPTKAIAINVWKWVFKRQYQVQFIACANCMQTVPEKLIKVMNVTQRTHFGLGKEMAKLG